MSVCRRYGELSRQWGCGESRFGGWDAGAAPASPTGAVRLQYACQPGKAPPPHSLIALPSMRAVLTPAILQASFNLSNFQLGLIPAVYFVSARQPALPALCGPSLSTPHGPQPPHACHVLGMLD
jgi:hypothetical protein